MAAQPLPVSIMDFSGGQVDGEHVTQLGRNQFEFFKNAYAVGKKMRGRPGAMKVSTAGAYTANLNSILTYRPAAASWTRTTVNVILGTQNGFAYLNGAAITAISSALPASAEPWHMVQYKDIVYAARAYALQSDSVLRRLTTSGVQDAGIAASILPAPTAVQGAAGILPAGTYTYVVTFRNGNTGAESNPGDSVPVTIVASKKVDLSVIPVSANAQVTQRRIYRSLINSSGVYYLVTTINDNVTTTYTDNISEDALGDAASYDNAIPPVGIIGVEKWGERLWGWGGNNVYYSRQLFPESWPATNLIPVGSDDNETIRQCLADGVGRRLLIGRTNSIYEITGTSDKNFRLDLVSAEHGVAGSHAMAAAEGLVFFFAGDNFYALQSGGREPQPISSVQIRKIVDLIPQANHKDVRVAVYPRLSWMVALVHYDGSTNHKLMLVYNYKTGAWFVFDFASFATYAPCFLAEAVEANFTSSLYAVVDSVSYRFLYKFTDAVFTDGAGVADGSVINAAARTAGISADGKLVFIKKVGVLGRFVRNDPPASTCPISITSVVDGTNYSTKAMDLPAPTLAETLVAPTTAQWNQKSISTAQKPGAFVQIQVSSSEVTNRLELVGISIDARVLNRVRKVA